MKPSPSRVALRHLKRACGEEGRPASRFHPYHQYTITSEEDEDATEPDHHGMHDRHT